jgi:chromosome partitioning protein
LRRTVIDALMGNDPLVGVSRETAVFALDVVPANHELALMDKILYKRQGYQYRLKQALSQISPGLYDYVLLDSPPSLAPLTLIALTAADLLLIPVQCEFYAAFTLRKAIQLALQIRQQTNPRLIYRVLVTMYDMRNKIHRMVLEQMQGGLSNVLFKTVIQVDTKLRESPAFGQPITTYAPRSRATRQYRELARELQDPAFIRSLHPVRHERPATSSQPQPGEWHRDGIQGEAADSEPSQREETKPELIEESHG